MIDIEKMEAAALAATQGEWVVSDHIYASDGKRIASYQMVSRDDCENEANATHIATANPAAVLELIEKYKGLEAENERLQGHVAGEYEEAMQELDKYGIPRADGDGPTFTLRGRILRFLVRMTSNVQAKPGAVGDSA